MIEQYNPYIEKLLRNEPWRAVGEGKTLCHGRLDWDGTKHWCCSSCGRIGTSPTPLHLPARQTMGFVEYLRRMAMAPVPPRAPAT